MPRPIIVIRQLCGDILMSFVSKKYCTVGISSAK
jgi:hypothetical protein